MRGFDLKYLLIFFFLMLTGCSAENDESTKPDGENQVEVSTQSIQTFELVTLKSNSNLKNTYSGTFGDQNIDIVKTSDSTLVFSVPEVAPGNHSLKFELGLVDFNVAETKVENVENQLNIILESREDEFANYFPLELDYEQEMQRANSFFKETKELYNSLSEEEKRLTALFFQANMQEFYVGDSFSVTKNSFEENQTPCPRDDYKSFYSCRADMLAYSADDLKRKSKKFLEMLILAGASTYLSPASAGLRFVGSSLAMATAAYLFMHDLYPTFVIFKDELVLFLKTNWILSESVFSTMNDEFYNNSPTLTNLNPIFRTINENDGNINEETNSFIESFASLNTYWTELTELFGRKEDFNGNMQAADLRKEEIHISNISNNDVEYIEHDAENITFKSLSGDEEEFSFDIKVEKEGFERSATIEAIVEGNPAKAWIGEYSYYNMNFEVLENGNIGKVYIHEEQAAEFNELLEGLEFSIARYNVEDQTESYYTPNSPSSPSFYRAGINLDFKVVNGEKRAQRVILKMFMDENEDVEHGYSSSGYYYLN